MLQGVLHKFFSCIVTCVYKPLRVLLANIVSAKFTQALVASSLVANSTPELATESPEKQSLSTTPASTVDGPQEDRIICNTGALSLQDGPPLQPQFCRNFSFAHKDDVGHRTRMEDRSKVADLSQHASFAHCQRAGFFAVFDGHAGPEVAEHLSTHLLTYFLEHPALISTPLEALRDAVLTCEEDVLAKGHAAGSTALAAVLIDDDLYVANVGDSRAVLSRRSQPKPNQLTTDHKPLQAAEWQRLVQAGAEISEDGYICGEVSVARALGSHHLKNDPQTCKYLICEPELKHVHLVEDDDFIILATDGLWDSLRNEDAVNRAKHQLGQNRNPLVCAQHLVDTAVKLKKEPEPHADNVSVVVVLLHDRPFALRKGNSMLFRNVKREGDMRADTPSSCGSAYNSPRLVIVEQQQVSECVSQQQM